MTDQSFTFDLSSLLSMEEHLSQGIVWRQTDEGVPYAFVEANTEMVKMVTKFGGHIIYEQFDFSGSSFDTSAPTTKIHLPYAAFPDANSLILFKLSLT